MVTGFDWEKYQSKKNLKDEDLEPQVLIAVQRAREAVKKLSDGGQHNLTILRRAGADAATEAFGGDVVKAYTKLHELELKANSEIAEFDGFIGSVGHDIMDVLGLRAAGEASNKNK